MTVRASQHARCGSLHVHDGDSQGDGPHIEAAPPMHFGDRNRRPALSPIAQPPSAPGPRPHAGDSRRRTRESRRAPRTARAHLHQTRRSPIALSYAGKAFARPFLSHAPLATCWEKIRFRSGGLLSPREPLHRGRIAIAACRSSQTRQPVELRGCKGRSSSPGSSQRRYPHEQHAARHHRPALDGQHVDLAVVLPDTCGCHRIEGHLQHVV